MKEKYRKKRVNFFVDQMPENLEKIKSNLMSWTNEALKRVAAKEHGVCLGTVNKILKKKGTLKRMR